MVHNHQGSTVNVFIFLVSGKKEGEEKRRETPPSLLYYFFFFQVGCTQYCHVIPHRGSVQPQELERVVQEPDCSKLS